ncbi:MAG TPA: rhodanese-like domain-containing protein [Pyrinomonadaceae bacterium]|nr:rhodanese-like domain-containing protein [Pyrinomonadaceae bacterium]
MNYQTISPVELREKIESGGKFRLIDVREPVEFGIARIEGAELLPMSRANEWLADLNPSEELVFFCHHGIRSGNVCAFLAQNGFEKLYNLAGGIDSWSEEVDNNVPRY